MSPPSHREDARGRGEPSAPAPPDDVDPGELDPAVRVELQSLGRPAAEAVSRHLVAVGRLIDDNPAQALAHAVAARQRAARIGAVREAVGLAAYHAGQWQTALAELRTYHRISGRQTHLAVIADCERGLGRPERAIDIYRTGQRPGLAPAEQVELLIVAAGARRDLGQREAAVAMLQVPELTAKGKAAWRARLCYAYAEALLDADRPREARHWFSRAVEVDEDVAGDTATDAAERLLELDGVLLAEAEPGDQDAPAPPPGPGEPASGRIVDEYDCVILDLDGVVYLTDQPIPSAVEAIARLWREGLPVVFATNNASRSADEVAALLARFGIEVDSSDVLTSAMVAADRLAQELAPGQPVLVVGADALVAQVRRVGLRPVVSADEQPVAVVQGYGSQLGWTQLAEACLAVRSGAWWVATNLDPTLPTPRGPVPGNGALVAALRTALGRGPDLVVGKPQPAFFHTAAHSAGSRNPLVVGDRLDTDIDGARRAGMDSLLVLTGASDEASVRTAPAEHRPTYVGADLAALFAAPASVMSSGFTAVCAA